MIDTLWYFAYGSNLAPETFLGQRRMQPLEVRCARLDHYRLVFDLPVGRHDRGVANIEPSRGSFVHGVAYRIHAAAALRLDRTEGVHRGFYQRIVADVVADGDERIRAFTYQSPHRRPGRRPSARYMNLILRGARHHGLPADYTRYLEGVELARRVPERERARANRGPS